MMAIAASNDMDRVVTVSPLNGLTYGEVLEANVDYFANSYDALEIRRGRASLELEVKRVVGWQRGVVAPPSALGADIGACSSARQGGHSVPQFRVIAFRGTGPRPAFGSL